MDTDETGYSRASATEPTASVLDGQTSDSLRHSTARLPPQPALLPMTKGYTFSGRLMRVLVSAMLYSRGGMSVARRVLGLVAQRRYS